MAGMTRGPLAAEVYWRRRLLVIGFALLLVLGLARLLGGGSDGSDPGRKTATQAGADPSVTPSLSVTPPAPTPSTKKQIRQAEKTAKAERKAQKAASKAAASASAAAVVASASAAAEAALPQPTGECADSDVVVTPSVASAVAGSDVAIGLELHTRFSQACTWKVSSESLALKITSGPEKIWSTQDCPKAVPVQDVTLRLASPATIQVVWTNAKRSDDSCSRRTQWASPGYYHVLAAALAGEPVDVQFELVKPTAPVVYETEKPKTGKKNGKQKNR